MMSDPDNNLATTNTLPPLTSASWISHQILSVTEHRYGITNVAIIMIVLVNIYVLILSKTTLSSCTYAAFIAKMLHFFSYLHQLRTTYVVCFSKFSDEELKEEEIELPDRALRLFTRFSLDELQSATRNFSQGLLIGRGGFGKVYTGVIGDQTVAIKRSKAHSRQSRCEFLTEIKTLCEVRHINLVSLIGYCNENREMILVYEYMCGGTLHDHLQKYAVNTDSDSFLSWKQRLNICIGAARGIEYLHTGHRIIHHDVKSANILLDENYMAKVADFGLAKHIDTSELESQHIEGTYGYTDPHYVDTHILTTKGDTYAFGVVLLEVLCERQALDRMAVGEDRPLANWARNRINEGKVSEIVAPSLIGEVSQYSLKTFVQVAESCLHYEPKKRPTMAQVVAKLELALEQHEGRNLSMPTQETRVSDIQTVTPSAIERTSSNHEPPIGYKDGRKIDMYLSCFWTRSAVRNRIKSAKELFPGTLSENPEANIKMCMFDFAKIADATNQFSSANIIGRGGFGCVYKAVLPAGQILAVKRLSVNSRQGDAEFMREIDSLSKLQHCTVIALLGFCTRGAERILVYEFMANRSLASHIHDEARSRFLNWALRFKIIIGIAEGIMYLHQGSGMKIIHRDIKPSNILLDTKMDPKICDFGLAITFEEDHESIVKNDVAAGTRGYMAPEYQLHSEVSVMTDVYSFGVLILVTLSGKRPIYTSHGKSLVAYAWKLWIEGKELDLVDNSIRGSASKEEALRCIQVGLLCTQAQHRDRPTMPSVLKMLTGEESSIYLHEKVVQAPVIVDKVQ